MSKEQKNIKQATEQPKDDYSSVPKSVMNLITKIATEKAVEIFNQQVKERRERMKDCRKKNTKLLLKKYRNLHKFAGNAVSDLTQLLSEEELVYLESMGLDNIETHRVENIKDRVIFTNTVLGHIDTMLELYKNKCLSTNRDEDARKWRVLDAMYISDTISTAEDIAENEYVDKRTVFRDLDIAVSELSGLFFGIDLSDLFWC